MRVKKPAKTAAAEPEPKTKGTIWAEKNRAQCNKLSDAECERLMERALEVIYGGKAAA